MLSASATFAQNRIHSDKYKIVVLNGGLSSTYINNTQKKLYSPFGLSGE